MRHPFPIYGNPPAEIIADSIVIETAPEKGYYLAQKKSTYQLCHPQQNPTIIDFTDNYYRYRGGKEYLPKAFKNMTGGQILDATAGWARDSWLLAYRGFQVTLCEKHPALYLLLKQGITHAREEPLTATVATRLTVQYGESEALIHAQGSKFDAIYLDPMYPPREKSAKVKKDMQILHELLAEETNNGDRLLLVAIDSGCPRIVVKRPKNAPFLANLAPHHSLNAPNTRFDIYLTDSRNKSKM